MCIYIYIDHICICIGICICICICICIYIYRYIYIYILTAMVPCQTCGTRMKPWACDGNTRGQYFDGRLRCIHGSALQSNVDVAGWNL